MKIMFKSMTQHDHGHAIDDAVDENYENKNVRLVPSHKKIDGPRRPKNRLLVPCGRKTSLANLLVPKPDIKPTRHGSCWLQSIVTMTRRVGTINVGAECFIMVHNAWF